MADIKIYETFFQIAFVQFWWPCVTFGLSFPFLADKVAHRKWLCGKITIYQHFVLKYSEQLLWHQQQCHIQSHLHHLSTLFWYSVWKSRGCFDHVRLPKCMKLLLCHWVIFALMKGWILPNVLVSVGTFPYQYFFVQLFVVSLNFCVYAETKWVGFFFFPFLVSLSNI